MQGADVLGRYQPSDGSLERRSIMIIQFTFDLVLSKKRMNAPATSLELSTSLVLVADKAVNILM